MVRGFESGRSVHGSGVPELHGLGKAFGRFGVIAGVSRILALPRFTLPAAGFHWVIERLDFVQDRKLNFVGPRLQESLPLRF